MIRTVTTRTELSEFLDKKVHVRAKVADFATGKYQRNSLKRKPTILLKDVVITKGKHEIRLDHLWIMPKLSRTLRELYVGDIVEFDATVYKYAKVSKRRKNLFIQAYSLKDIKNFFIVEYSTNPEKSIEQAILQCI